MFIQLWGERALGALQQCKTRQYLKILRAVSLLGFLPALTGCSISEEKMRE